MNTFEFAIKMEKDGERYYSEQAGLNSDNPMGRVFTILAKAEQKHARLLSSRSQNTQPDGDENQPDTENVFTSLADFKIDVSTIPKQLAVYRLALEIEQKSIDLYTDLLGRAETDHDRNLLHFIISQEQQHFVLFDELITLVQRPEEWVENAEFGKRPEY